MDDLRINDIQVESSKEKGKEKIENNDPSKKQHDEFLNDD